MKVFSRTSHTRVSVRTISSVLLLVVAMLVGATGRGHAQSTFGTLTGDVTDPSGAAIANAAVSVAEGSTGAERKTTSDSRGEFTVTNIDASTYNVTVSASGFNEREFKDVQVLARQTVRLDAKLGVAGALQTVQVTAGGEVIGGDLIQSNSKSGDEINQLALNFRASLDTSPIKVAVLAPTVQTDPAGNISIAGGLPNETSFSLDGISTQNVRNGGPNHDLFPSVESIAEFKVNTGSNNAEFGQPSDLTVTTKSGNNNFHGSLFYFHQNAAFNAADPFAHRVTPVVSNDFGVSVGGPVTIPRVYKGRDRTFFFFTYEGTRQPHTSLSNIIVPSTAYRNGDLTADPNPIFFPGTTTPLPTKNLASLGIVNPVSLKVLQALFPLPNVANGPPDQVSTYAIKGNYTLNGFDGRVDQVVTQNQRVYVRYSNKDVTDVGTGNNGSYNPLLGAFTTATKLKNLVGSYNWVIRPTVVNELRAGFTRVNTALTFPLALQGGALNASFGFQNLPPVPSSGGVADFNVGSYVGGDTNSFGRPRHVQQHIYEVGDNVSLLAKDHSIKVGANYTRTSYVDQITFTNGDEFGDFNFSGAVTGDPFADFLIGQTTFADYAQNGPDGKPFASHYGFFGQDDWKVNHRLTISYGLRYEVNPPFDDETKQLGQFDRNFPGGRLIVQGSRGLAQVAPSWRAQVGSTPFVLNSTAGLPIGLRKTYYGNVQPRFGVILDATGDGKTVLKAHVGAYSVPVLGAVLYSLLGVDTSNFPEFPLANLSAPFGSSGATLENCNSGTLPPDNITVIASCPGYRRANQPNLKDPRVVQWNGSVERALSANTVIKLLYTGSHTTQLIYSPDLNQLRPNTIGYAALTATPALRQANLKYPNFSEVLTRDNGASAKYNAGTIELQHRLSSGLTYDASYTLAKNQSNALGSAPSSLIGGGGQGDNGANAQNYFDITGDYGDVIFTRRNRFVNTFLYDLPFGRGKRFLANSSRLVDFLVGGFDLTGVTVLQSGACLTPTFRSGNDPSGTNPGQRSGGNFQRPDCVPGVDPNRKTTPGRYFNKAAFQVPGNNIGRFGNCSVGSLLGPGTKVFSATIGKEAHLTEGVALRYEAAFANLLNIRNLGNPDTRITNASFGTVSAEQISEQAGPRTTEITVPLRDSKGSTLLNKRYDVAVVGAGILGLAHAYAAANAGLSVIVFERSPRASGASVRNFGMLWPIGQPAGAMLQLAQRSREIWLNVLRQAGLAYRATGSLHLAYREDEARVGEEFSVVGPPLGYKCSWLTPAAVLQRSEAVQPEKLLGGLWSDAECTVDPRQILQQLPAFLEERYGVRFIFGAAVHSIAAPKIEAGDGQWEADTVIVCSGEDFETLYPQHYAASGLTRCKLQMMRTPPQPDGWQLGPSLAAGLTLRFYPAFAVCSWLPALSRRIAEEMPEYDRWAIHALVSQTSDGALTLGDSHEYGLAVDIFNKSAVDDLILKYTQQFLRAPDLTIAERWYGVYAKHPNRPLVVMHPEERVRIVASPGGSGMTLAFGVGEQSIEELGLAHA